MNPELWILWATAIATLGVYSILLRENPVSRLFEHIFVGLSLGYLVVSVWTENLAGKWWSPMVHQGQWYWIFAPVIGLLFYFIFSARYAWLARLAMGLFFGVAAGTFFRQFFPLYWPQVTSSLKPLLPYAKTATPPGWPPNWPLRLTWADAILHNWIALIILVSVVSYFIFSVRHEGTGGRTLAWSARWGRWFLMIAFGAMFGNTVMARMSLFIGRVQYLLQEWLGHYWHWLAGRLT